MAKNKPICSIAECGKAHVAKGLCGKHYQRLKKNGDALQRRAKTRSCSVLGCEGTYLAKGFCSKHYLRKRSNGDPLNLKIAQRGDGLLFIQNAISSDTDNCILWPNSGNEDGYGTFKVDGKKWIVTRYICTQVYGKPPHPRSMALHSCATPGCCNPRHLRWGSHKDNAADRRLDGNHITKLTDEQVFEIRSLCGSKADAKIGAMFGVSRSLISMIRRRQIWTHI